MPAIVMPHVATSAATSSGPSSTTIAIGVRSEEHTSELQSLTNLVCRLLLEKKKQHFKATAPNKPGTPRSKDHHLPYPAEPREERGPKTRLTLHRDPEHTMHHNSSHNQPIRA